jgi:hypothetical protein
MGFSYSFNVRVNGLEKASESAAFESPAGLKNLRS